MKTTFTFLAVLLLAATNVFTQGNSEQELRRIIADYDKAFLARDVTFFEKTLADDYFYTGSTGETQTKAQALEELKKLKASTDHKLAEMRSEDVIVRVVGDTGIVTGAWIATGTEDSSEPHTDSGRYTVVLEQRNGRWLVVTEHTSENQHDRKAMEQQVIAASKAYTELLRNGEVAAFERFYAKEYSFVNEEGKMFTRDEVLARRKKSNAKIDLTEVTDQKIRIIGNGTAVETATFRAKGTNDGKAFDDTERYTSTWVWRDSRWQIVADHITAVRK